MKIKYIYIALWSIITINAFSQTTKEKKADSEYQKYAYIDAIKTYERLAEKGYKSADMFKKLANSYYFNADLEQAQKWYKELFALTSDVEPEYYYRYAQSLKSTKNYKLADEMMAKFTALDSKDSRGLLAKSSKDYLLEIKNNSGRYTIEDAGINSKYSDYGSAFYNDKIVFTSTKDTGGVSKRKHTWTGESFSKMYVSTISQDGALSSVEVFAKELDSKYNEATPVFTKDGNTVYFTRNNFLNGKKGYSEDKVILLKIYRATIVGNKWTNIIELPFNNNNYQVAHPALSPDEKTLYFASDMPGGFGQSDLYQVEIKADDSFGTPVNLGKTINTEGRETFPFVSKNGELYFSTDGLSGLGGLDIYGSKYEKDGSLTKPQNIGEPANSPKDDFAYIIDSTTKKGFLTSNRDGGNGSDDIYKFTEIKEVKFIHKHFLNGVVNDTETGETIPNAVITLYNDSFKQLKQFTTNVNGTFDFGQIESGKKYYVRAEHPDFNTNELPITIPDEEGTSELPILLERKVKPVKVGDDLAKTFNIKIIYFDLDKSNIRRDAALDLAKILDVLIENPTMEIDIRSHTDSRQTHKYNERLSDKRAKSTIAWLVKNGVAKERLTGNGYGETQLVNKCADNVECSEEDHQLNRRSEFVITTL